MSEALSPTTCTDLTALECYIEDFMLPGEPHVQWAFDEAGAPPDMAGTRVELLVYAPEGVRSFNAVRWLGRKASSVEVADYAVRDYGRNRLVRWPQGALAVGDVVYQEAENRERPLSFDAAHMTELADMLRFAVPVPRQPKVRQRTWWSDVDWERALTDIGKGGYGMHGGPFIP